MRLTIRAGSAALNYDWKICCTTSLMKEDAGLQALNMKYGGHNWRGLSGSIKGTMPRVHQTAYLPRDFDVKGHFKRSQDRILVLNEPPAYKGR
jgi:hypothetical protein